MWTFHSHKFIGSEFLLRVKASESIAMKFIETVQNKPYVQMKEKFQ